MISISIMCVRISKKTPYALLTLMKTPVASALVYRFSSPDSCSQGEGVTTLLALSYGPCVSDIDVQDQVPQAVLYALSLSVFIL